MVLEEEKIKLVMKFPHMADIHFTANTRLLEKCLKINGEILSPNKIVQGRVVSGQRFVSELSTKKLINEKMQADCIEMEGAAVAHACYLHNIPFVIIRSISDCLKDDGINASISFQQFLSKACLQLKIILKELFVYL